MTDTITAYKATRRDGLDHHTQTVDYRDAVGHDIVIYDEAGPAKLCSSSVLHACRSPLDVFRFAPLDSAIFEVTGTPVTQDKYKAGFERLHIVAEVPRGPVLDELLGFRHAEACDPVNPWQVPPVAVTARHLELLAQWNSARASGVWDLLRGAVGWTVWGDSMAWASAWNSMWDSAWASAWNSMWDSMAWASAWNSMWAYTGSFFPAAFPSPYPFQCAVDLFHDGLVPSYDGTLWRLHSAPYGHVVWEGEL